MTRSIEVAPGVFQDTFGEGNPTRGVDKPDISQKDRLREDPLWGKWIYGVVCKGGKIFLCPRQTAFLGSGNKHDDGYYEYRATMIIPADIFVWLGQQTEKYNDRIDADREKV